MRNTFAKTILEHAKLNPRILLLTGDLGFGVLDSFQEELPGQFINFGINEQSMMGAAAGLAKEGFRPFVYSIGNFPTFRCLEQIRNDVAYMRLGVVIVALGAGFSYGTAGYSHHLIEDISALRVFQNLEMLSPADPAETRIATEYLATSHLPAYLRLGKGGELNLDGNFPNGDLSKPRLISSGSKGVILFTGSIGNSVLSAKEILKNRDLNPFVYSVPRLNPINLEEFSSRHQGQPILTVEEHVLSGGFGSLILENLENVSAFPKFSRLGIKGKLDTFSGSQEYLREKYGIGVNEIVSTFMNLTSTFEV